MSIRRSWTCRFLERNGPLLIFTGKFETEVDHPELGFIGRGTISHEYYWLDRWYNVFRFHESDGTFRNYYCNINMPPKFANGVLDYVDLEMDVLVQPDFGYKVLDLDEFEVNSVKFGYPADVVCNAKNALAEVIESIETRQFPFGM